MVVLWYTQVGVFFALFVAMIVYNRMEFTITRDEKWEVARSKVVLATYMEQIQALLEGKRDWQQQRDHKAELGINFHVCLPPMRCQLDMFLPLSLGPIRAGENII